MLSPLFMIYLSREVLSLHKGLTLSSVRVLIDDFCGLCAILLTPLCYDHPSRVIWLNGEHSVLSFVIFIQYPESWKTHLKNTTRYGLVQLVNKMHEKNPSGITNFDLHWHFRLHSCFPREPAYSQCKTWKHAQHVNKTWSFGVKNVINFVTWVRKRFIGQTWKVWD